MLLLLHPGLVGTSVLGASVGPSCPRWCRSESTRSWACETQECGVCLEACSGLFRDVNNDDTESEDFNEKHQTWTCPPVWPPQHFFAIFTMARSASSTSCGVINTLGDAECAHELLDPVARRELRPEEEALIHSDPVGYLKNTFMATYSHLDAAPCTWGFVLFAEHTSNTTLHDWLWDHLDVAIVLERHDGAPPQSTAGAVQHLSQSPALPYRSGL